MMGAPLRVVVLTAALVLLANASTILEDYAECRDHEQFGNLSLICDAEHRLQRTTLRNLDSLLRDLQTKIPCECENGCVRGADRSDKYLGLLLVTTTTKINASAADGTNDAKAMLNATARRIYEDARLGDDACDNGLLILYIKDQQKLATYRGRGHFALLDDDDMKRLYKLARKDAQIREADSEGGALQALITNYDDRRRANASGGNGILRAESWAPIVGLTLALLVVLLILAALFAFLLARLCCCCCRKKADRKHKYYVSPSGSPAAGYGTVEYIVTPPVSEHGYSHHHPHHHHHGHHRHSTLYAQSPSPDGAVDYSAYSSPYGGDAPFVTHPPRSRSVTPTSMHRTRIHPRRSTSSTRGSQIIHATPSTHSSKRERINRRSVLASGSSGASAGVATFYVPPGYAPGASGGDWPRRPSSQPAHGTNVAADAPSDASDGGVGEPIPFLDPNRKREVQTKREFIG